MIIIKRWGPSSLVLFVICHLFPIDIIKDIITIGKTKYILAYTYSLLVNIGLLIISEDTKLANEKNNWNIGLVRCFRILNTR